MYCDVPQCKRCCFCIPLRHGILIFGYLNLILTTLYISLTCYHLSIMDEERTTKNVVSLYHGLILYYHAALPITLYSIELIFTLLLIVGAHMKKDRILRIYFWYGVVTTASSIVAFFVQLDYTIFFLEDAVVMFCGLVIHVYLILLIWWEMKKLNNGEKFRFVNRTTVLQEIMDENVICTEPKKNEENV